MTLVLNVTNLKYRKYDITEAMPSEILENIFLYSIISLANFHLKLKIVLPYVETACLPSSETGIMGALQQRVGTETERFKDKKLCCGYL